MISVILAGGRNSRFPYPKGFIEVGGERIIERNLEILREISDNVIISTNDPEPYFYLGAPMIGDVLGSSGPMSGIYSALYCTSAEDVFVIACDMPYINKMLAGHIIKNKDGDAAVPLFKGKPEPLFAVYSRSILDKMESLIRSGNTSLIRMLEGLSVRYIPEEDIKGIDPEGRSFTNVNTPEECEFVIK